jgi:predicted AAA+ superfamily ATPase
MNEIKRVAIQKIREASEEFPALLVTGARQVGKTTLLKGASTDDRTFVSLDSLLMRDLAQRDPKLFLSTYKPPVFIDEIQYAPQLLPYIKEMIDANPEKSGQFWLSGSQQFHLMRCASESLAGRVAIFTLGGIAQEEIIERFHKDVFSAGETISPIEQFEDVEVIFNRIFQGSYPAVVAKRVKNWELFYRSYVATYIERDVRELTKVSDEMRFLQFIKAVAARTGQILNYSALAKDVGISLVTAKDWIGILKASNLVYLLSPYSRNVTSRIVKTPKLYFMDTGLCCYLLGWDSPRTLMNGAISGPLFETFVVGEVLKRYWNRAKEPRLYFYRDKHGVEIDLLIEHNGLLEPIEIKKCTNPTVSDIKAFRKVQELGYPLGKGAVICAATQGMPLTEDVNIVPVGAL